MSSWLDFALDAGQGSNGDGVEDDEIMCASIAPLPRAEHVDAPAPARVDALVVWEPPDRSLTVADVSSTELSLLLQAPGPYAVVPLAGVFERVGAIASRDKGSLDIDMIGLASHFIGCDDLSGTLCSKEVLAQILEMNRRLVEPKLSLLANSMFHADRSAINTFCSGLQRRCRRASMFLECSRYDSTQLKVGTDDFLDDIARRDVEQSGALGPRVGDQVVLPTLASRAQPLAIGKSSARCSLMASEHRHAALVQLDDPSGTWMAFFGESLTWVQLTDRCTSVAEERAITEASCVFPSSDHFALKVRCVTTDSANTNFAVERRMCESRGCAWRSLHLPCNVHKVSTCYSRTLGFIDGDISAWLNLSLSLSSNAALRTFRRALGQIIAERLVVRVGVPPVHYRQHQQAALDLFLSGPEHEGNRALLMNALNGDWTDRLQVWTPPGEAQALDRNQLVRLIVRCLVCCCCSRNFRLYPRHRWTGADAAVDDIGLLVCIHQLMGPVYNRFVQMSESRGTEPSDRPRADAVAPSVAPMMVDGAPLHMGPGPHMASCDGAADATTMAATNARHRSIAAKWMASGAWHILWVCRTVMEPLRELMTSYLDSSGEHWEAEQRAAAASTPPPTTGDPPSRAFRVVDYANLVFENKFFETLNRVWHPSAWVHMPASGWYCSNRCLVFRMLSRAGCLVTKHLVSPAKKCPVQLFKLVRDRELWHTIHAIPECMRDEFSQAFLVAHPGPELAGEEARHRLLLLSLMLRVENVQVELGHSRVRRNIIGQSNQTHIVSIGYTNAQLILSQVRLRRLRHRGGGMVNLVRKHTKRQPASRSRHGPSKATSRRGGGGLYRAWLHKYGRSRNASLSVLAAEFRTWRDRGGADVADLRRQGQQGTNTHRVGGNAFGLGGKALRRFRERRFRDAALDRGVDPVAAGQLAYQQRPVLQDASAVDCVLTIARSATRKRAAIKQRSDERMGDTLLKFAAERRASTKAAAELIGLRPDFVSGIVPVPSGGNLLCNEVCFDVSQQATTVAAWACANARKCNLKAVIERDWKHKNRLICDEDQQHNGNRDQRKPCLRWGYCICSPSGREVHRLRNALVKVLKLRCPPGSPSRELLRDAFLVVKLAWRCEVVASPWLAFAVATASPSVPQGQETPQGAIWAHIGFHNFSPYRPCFQILEHVERPSGAYTWLRATQQFKYDYDFVELMHRGSRWGMSMHVLVATQSPLGSFDPQEVLVRRLCSDEEDDRIWPPRRPFRRREPAPEPRAHDAEPAEDFEDVALVPGALDSEDTDNVGPDSESSAAEDEALLGELGDDDSVGDIHGDDDDELAAALHLAGDAMFSESGSPLEGVPVIGEAPELAGDDGLLVVAEPPPHVFADGGLELVVAEPDALAAPIAAPEEALPPEGADPVLRIGAIATVGLEGGDIRYYRKGDFTATCRFHPGCILTRTSMPGRRPAQGRPLGLLAAWLSLRPESKAEHFNRANWPDAARRQAARVELSHVFGSAELFACERPRRDGEGVEPDGCP